MITIDSEAAFNSVDADNARVNIDTRLPNLSLADISLFRSLAYAAHKNAVEKQWWEIDSEGRVDFRSRNQDEMFLLAVSEIIEAFEVFRDGHPLNEIWWDEEKDKKPEGFPIEIADFVIRAMDNVVAAGIIEPFCRFASNETIRCSDTGIGVQANVGSTGFGIVTGIVVISDKIEKGDVWAAMKYGVAVLRACFGLAVKYDFDLWKAIKTKMAFNLTRPVRHGGKLA